ncbi:diflavin flavoprotein [Prochlorococcus sp. MIT 1300]|uniref:diflavin flavoprotein n=1 Tax=Prochlorococcus sp. MIT 1300 TaxID=3096218 RepID=UPI002A751CCB|nr:diflavin flavoprotein [Prochlorococcus sp. MIT 1300]
MRLFGSKHSQQGSDQLKVIKIPIDDGLISLRGLSPKRLRFEVEYGLERGSTDNSFLFSDVNTGNSDHNYQTAILVHPPGATYSKEFIPALKNALKERIEKLQIIVGHVNPNRVNLLRELATLFPEVELFSSNPGAKLLKELWNQQKPNAFKNNSKGQQDIPSLPKIQIVRQEKEISTSSGHTICLIAAPTPRWPGGLIAFEKKLGLLMSDKFFAAHLCAPEWAEANSNNTEEDRRHFYECLMAPMATQVTTLVDKLETLDIQTLAPGHGPAISTSWRSLLNSYQRWGEAQQQGSLTVALLFASAYGNTAAIADALAQGVSRTGVLVESLNCEFTPADQLLKTIQRADGYLIGSPTLGGHAPTPIVSALGTLLSEGDRSKPVGIFGSFGWSGEALDLLESKLQDGGFKFGFEPIKIKFSPDMTTLKTISETGTQFARELKKQKRLLQKRTKGGLTESRSDPAVLALGRVVGSLSVLTARKNTEKETLSGAMVASWISQASFTPPGLTVAVAKDRAIETLLHRDDSFTLNVLSAGNEQKIMKQFLQPFAPGADRFSGVVLEHSPGGHPILPKALAWLECTVRQRIECGDHWLIYAEVDHGKVLDKEGVTAVHHRKSGANY